MSMKSFDKICEKIILNEPGSEKEIFDERQKQQRTQLMLAALLIYAVSSALLVLLNDCTPGFLESDISGLVFCAGAAYLAWVIMAAAKGCLFGVSGKRVVSGALMMLVLLPFYTWNIVYKRDEEQFSFIRNARLSEEVMVLGALIFMAASAVIVLVINHRNKNSEEGKTNS